MDKPPVSTKTKLRAKPGRLHVRKREIPYRGVKRVDEKRWMAKVWIGRVLKHLGTWPTEEGAAIAFDRAVLQYRGTTARRNFPERRLKPADFKQLQVEAGQARGVRAQSGYFGVFHSGTANKSWTAVVRANGKYERLGVWASAKGAAEAHDRAVLLYHGEQGQRNFPRRRLRPADAAQLRAEAHRAYKARTSSQHHGVTHAPRGWIATVGPYFLGTWWSEDKAAEARDRAMLFLGGPTEKLNFPFRTLTPTSPSDLRVEARQDVKRRSQVSYTSRYLGVSYNRRSWRRPWQVTLTCAGERYHMGQWKSEAVAARGYDRAVRHLKPGKAPLNFPDEDNPPASPATLRAEARREGRGR